MILARLSPRTHDPPPMFLLLIQDLVASSFLAENDGFKVAFRKRLAASGGTIIIGCVKLKAGQQSMPHTAETQVGEPA